MMLRVQAERMNGGFFPSAREYSVTLRAVRAAPGAAARARRRAAPGPDAARHGDRVVGGRFVASRLCCNRFPTVCTCGWRCCSICWSVPDQPAETGVSAHERADPRRAALRRGRPVDVLVADGQIAEIGAGSGGRSGPMPTSSTRPVRCCCPASSTCTPICASRAASTPRHRNRFGGSGSRRLHRGVRDGQHRTGRRLAGGHRPRLAPRAAGRPGRRAPGRRGHRRAGGQAAHRDGHDGRRRRARCGCSPTTACASTTRW